jgi:UDP-glucose 4-epimerase
VAAWPTVQSGFDRYLADRGYQTVVADNLSTGHADAVHHDAILRISEIGDTVFMRSVLHEFKPACAMHFAAASLVGDLMLQPSKYWQNNLVQTLSLLDTMRECKVDPFIFSTDTCGMWRTLSGLHH